MNISAMTNNDRPFLAKLHLALFVRKIGLGDFAAARQELAEAIKLSPGLIEQLEELLPDWAMKQAYGSPLALAQGVLDNLPGDLMRAGQLQQHVLGKIHLAQAFDDYNLGHGAEARQHIFNSMRYDRSILKNRGVLAMLARSFLHQHAADLKVEPALSEADENIPAAVATAIEAALGSPIDKVERITITRRRIYLVQTGQQEYILHILEAEKDLLVRKLAVTERIRAAGIPAPAPVVSSLSLPEGEQELDWLLEEKMTGLVFDPRIMAQTDQLSVLADLGRCLRRLHRIKVSGFGRLSSANLEAPYPTFAAWLDSKQAAIAKACLAGAIPETVLPSLDAAYRFLLESYSAGPAVLCHCEITDGNIFFTAGRVSALIDWNSVSGTDPAYDVANFFTTMSRYWYPQQDEAMLAVFLEAYQPDEPDNFYRRVIAHRLLFSAETMIWMSQDDELYLLLPSIMSAASLNLFQPSIGAVSA